MKTESSLGNFSSGYHIIVLNWYCKSLDNKILTGITFVLSKYSIEFKIVQ